MKRLEHSEPERMRRLEILEAVRGSESTCVDAILAAALNEDVEFAEPLVMAAASHASPLVRRIAMVSVGHMARIHKDVESTRRLLAVLRRGAADEDAEVRGATGDAIGDISVFVSTLADDAEIIQKGMISPSLTETVRRWYAAKQDAVADAGITANFFEAESTDERSGYVDLESATKLARATVWDRGLCDIEVHSIATGETLADQHHEAVDTARLEVLLDDLANQLATSKPSKT